MEVQRQQLQAAVEQMEAALKDPVQGPDNVSIYKQYWDQYSGSLEALSKENPLMHHLLQVDEQHLAIWGFCFDIYQIAGHASIIAALNISSFC